MRYSEVRLLLHQVAQADGRYDLVVAWYAPDTTSGWWVILRDHARGEEVALATGAPVTNPCFAVPAPVSSWPAGTRVPRSPVYEDMAALTWPQMVHTLQLPRFGPKQV